MRFRSTAVLAALLATRGAMAAPAPTPTPAAKSWTFVVGGDSRNCGDVVMPAVAAGAAARNAQLYWHLGDFRAIYDFDEDFLAQPERAGRHVAIADYERLAWDDFIQSQLVPFGKIPVFLALGNHETTSPKIRTEYLTNFADWLMVPAIRDQRLRDDPKDHRLRAYYHWIQGGVDFVTLDNATEDQFDSQQMRWFDGVISRAEKNPEVRAIAVGMHAALPDSLASDHSMNDWAQGEKSGRRVYGRLVAARRVKPVYIFASHSHFYMSGIFDTAQKQTSGEAIPGWIVGTTGAIRYPLPEGASRAKEAKTDTYGFLVGTVEPEGEKPGTLRLEFQEIAEKDIPADTVKRYGTEFVHKCFEANRRAPSPTPTPAPAPDAAPTKSGGN
ncbi:MAG TPA: metallophosphoesterase [Thermoanaerobaculia bacterium]